MSDAAAFDDAAHYARLYREAPREFAFRAATREGFEAWQRGFRPRLREALGLAAMESDLAGHEPRAERVEAETLGGFTRERWLVWTEPDVPLPVWVLRPARPAAFGGEARPPLVVTPHGHNHPEIYAGIARSDDERRSMREGERDVAVQAAREGYVAVVPTARGFGGTRNAADREKDSLSSCRVRLLHGLLVGRTAIGERVWDISRLIDWAVDSLGIDPARIAVTGNSGGGTTSLFAAACEERIRVAAPSSYFCTFEASIGSIHHCDCNYVPGILRLGGMADVAGLTAPRPFVAICGVEDRIFPIEGARDSFRALEEIYEVAGVPDRVEIHEGAGGHRYYAAGSWPFVRKWFASPP